jgi:hypothetical protein
MAPPPIEMAGRLARIALSLAAALVAAMLFVTLAGLGEPALRHLATRLAVALLNAFVGESLATGDVSGSLAAAAGLYMLAVGVLAGPPMAAALVGEACGWRSCVWYAGAAATLSAGLPWLARGPQRSGSEAEYRLTLLLFLTGAVSGLVYWMLAGRRAGRLSAS